MVESLNTKADLVINATSHLGLTDYGKIMIGDKGFEFYDDRDANNYIQIPWGEVDQVVLPLAPGELVGECCSQMCLGQGIKSLLAIMAL